MAAWHRSRRADIGLRATGLLLCWVSYTAMSQVVAMHVSPHKAGILAYGIAAVGFIAASAGSALTLWGRHLFDEIEVSARWRGRPDLSVSIPPGGNIEMDIPEPAMLVVGRDIDGDWTVRESAGMLLGRFSSAQAAQRFAEAERSGADGPPFRSRARPAVRVGSRGGWAWSAIGH
ncbi:hypothetical protein [Sphingomonas sp. Leaf33]|uniref:hypothetical protein n=1 Tax=Sphingomonas sp. Leaf33 TaxID=1736215 RepID=UPI0012E22F6D|nr:hypothetical protein [Sphingomonas sp. Leaf33]